MTRLHLFILIYFITLTHAYVIDELMIAGGRSAGSGYTSATQSDVWSAFNNQAGLAWYKDPTAGVYFENRFLLKEVSGKVLVIALPVGKGTFGLSFSQFGYSLYSEMKGGISYGMCLTKKLSAGIQIGYFRLHIADGFRDNSLYPCQIGLQFRANSHVWLGFHLLNIVPFSTSRETKTLLPTAIQFGFSWIITDGLHTDLEFNKNLNDPASIRGGIEYCPLKPVYIRIGIQSDPSTFTFGFGFEFTNIRIDLASSYNLALGYSPQASIIYFFKKRKR